MPAKCTIQHEVQPNWELNVLPETLVAEYFRLKDMITKLSKFTRNTFMFTTHTVSKSKPIKILLVFYLSPSVSSFSPLVV
ncbi:unnamed protein product [Adineta ricciae]|uniref:Uncharacterized protein n=1 Tax=Adineta ricciae TaxID=249248 RepID=A0A813ZS52_ADIRI|nr:unnamed protein product [Adineta ricciae]